MPPEKIGRYQVKAELGRGGMATVYRAYDPSFEREVAVKVLPREFLHDPQFHDRFKREIKTIALLEHPAIVPVYDVGEEDGVPYFVMRYMPGGSLTQWIEKGKFSLKDAARIIERVASALAYAHKNGVVHRDLKPDNILFDNNGDPFISDFGVSKFMDSVTNMTGSGIIGTPAYMSPEQAQGEQVDNRSDIYGLGVIIFQMLSGQQPYNATTPMGVAVKHITDPVPEILKANPDLPQSTDTIIKTAMAKNRDERYPTATELAQALHQAAFGESVSAPSTSTAKAAPAGRRGLVIGGAVVVVVALAAAFLFRSSLFGPRPQTPTLPSAAPAALVPVTNTALAATIAPLSTAVQPATGLSSPAAQFAPVCAPGVIPKYTAPAVSLYQQLCTKKLPYTLVAIPTGATFTSLQTGFTCTEVGPQGGNRLISCTGTNAYSFQIKVCIPAPTPASSEVVGQCGPGTEYNYTNKCCAPPAPADAGCTTFQVDLRACS